METLKQSNKKKMNLFLNSNSNSRIYFILLLSFLVTIRSFSQSVSKQITPNVTMVQVDDYLLTLKSLPQNSSNVSPYNRLQSLLKDVQSSIYLTKRVIKTYGNSPVCAYSDVSSFSLLNSKIPLNNDVEILTIKIDSPSDLKSPIDICSISNLNILIYIYLQVNFDCKLKELNKFIENCKTDHIVIYKIEKGA